MFTRSQQNKNYKEAVKFVEKCKRSEVNHDSTQQPFMMKNPLSDGAIDFQTNEVNKIFENVPIHDKLKKIYQVIGNPQVEYYYGEDWTLLSLNKIKSLYENYKKEGQIRAVDFAMIYAGMGHVIVTSYDPVSDKIYYRHSGGANGYEQDDNYKFSIKYIPKETELYDINHWFDIVKKDGTDAFSLPMVRMY